MIDNMPKQNYKGGRSACRQACGIRWSLLGRFCHAFGKNVQVEPADGISESVMGLLEMDTLFSSLCIRKLCHRSTGFLHLDERRRFKCFFIAIRRCSILMSGWWLPLLPSLRKYKWYFLVGAWIGTLFLLAMYMPLLHYIEHSHS